MKLRLPFTLKETKPITNSISKIVSNSTTGIGEDPEVSFSKLIEYHDCTPQIQIGVTAYSELITGTEMQINSDDKRAKKLIEEWNEENDFYTKFEGVVSTLLICGNAILEKLDEKKTQDVVEVDMSSIIRKERDEYGNLKYYEQQLQHGGKQRLGEQNIDRFIEFNLTNYSRQPWGRSLFYALAKSRTVGNRTTRPLVEILWATEDAMSAIIVNDAYPIKTITLTGADETMLKKEAEKWRKYKPGDSIIQSRKADIEFFQSQNTTGKYTDFIDKLYKTVELGIKFPHDILTGDFTSRASSETTENIVLKLARGFQRYLANKLKQELYDPILLQNNIEPKKAKLSVSFTTQNITKLSADTIKFLVDSGVITKNEGRIWLKANTGMDLPDDSVIEQGELNKQEDRLLIQNQSNDKNPFVNKFSKESFGYEETKKIMENNG